jgi:hypothetical protein
LAHVVLGEASDARRTLHRRRATASSIAPTERELQALVERIAERIGRALEHAGIGIEADARGKLERLCRYVSRPAIAVERLSLTPQGEVHYRLKTPYRAERRTSCSSRWTSSRGLRHSCRRRVHTRPGITACSHPVAHYVRR